MERKIASNVSRPSTKSWTRFGCGVNSGPNLPKILPKVLQRGSISSGIAYPPEGSLYFDAKASTCGENAVSARVLFFI